MTADPVCSERERGWNAWSTTLNLCRGVVHRPWYRLLIDGNELVERCLNATKRVGNVRKIVIDEIGSTVFLITIPNLRVYRWNHCQTPWRSVFGVRCSAFGVRHSAFDVRRPALSKIHFSVDHSWHYASGIWLRYCEEESNWRNDHDWKFYRIKLTF